ncbi:MAG: DUF3710 domain-containing protein, partial [Actinomycetales bacterium]
STDTTVPAEDLAPEESTAEQAGPAGGPWDAADAPAGERVDLGALQIPVHEGYAIQVPPEEGTTDRLAVLLVTAESVLELRAFAAGRTGSLWEEVRNDLKAEVDRLGGQHTEAPGPFGTELRTGIPAELPDGQEGVQPGRIIGVDGPRWFLRGTLLGLAAFDDDAAEPLVAALRDVVVVRGSGPMMSREALPLTLDPSIPLLDENGLEPDDA